MIRDYKGYDFTNEIAESQTIEQCNLAETPTSAVQYCLSKNKQGEKKWYLPAIDEMEEIVMSTYGGGVGFSYSRFVDFRAKFYWSSQPAYVNNYLHVERLLGDRYGVYMGDNTELARATKVYYKGGNPNDSSNYDIVDSGLKNLMNENDDEDTFDDDIFKKATLMVHRYTSGTYRDISSSFSISKNNIEISYPDKSSGGNNHGDWTHNFIKPEYHDGAKKRTDYARVRCVRKMN